MNLKFASLKNPYTFKISQELLPRIAIKKNKKKINRNTFFYLHATIFKFNCIPI